MSSVIYFVLAVIAQCTALHGLVVLLRIKVIVQSDFSVGLPFMSTLHPNSQYKGWTTNPELDPLNTMKYTRDQLFDLRPVAVNIKLPNTVYSTLKENGLLKGRGRRAGTYSPHRHSRARPLCAYFHTFSMLRTRLLVFEFHAFSNVCNQTGRSTYMILPVWYYSSD